MKLPKYLITVTQFSKITALILFFILPVVAFYFGIYYQQSKPIKTEYITQERLIKVFPTETQTDLINRCGDYPLSVLKATPCGKFNSCGGPSWSPDCRYIAWSLHRSVPGGWIASSESEEKELQELPSFDNLQTQSDEGVFLYENKTGNVKTIYHPRTKKGARYFKEWKDSNTVIFTSQEKTYSYDLKSDSIKNE